MRERGREFFFLIFQKQIDLYISCRATSVSGLRIHLILKVKADMTIGLHLTLVISLSDYSFSPCFYIIDDVPNKLNYIHLINTEILTNRIIFE